MKTIDIDTMYKIEPVLGHDNFLAPKHVFIPVDGEVLVKNGDYIFKNQLVVRNKDFFCSVSGVVLGYDEIETTRGLKKVIKIANDFKENSQIKNFVNHQIKLSKDDLLKLLKEKYQITIDKEIKTIYINGIDEDPYVFNSYNLINDHLGTLMDFADELVEVIGCKDAIFLFKASYSHLIEAFNVTVGEYKHLSYRIMPNYYGLGFKKVMMNYLNDNDSIVLSSLELDNLFYELRKERKNDCQYITIKNGDKIRIFLVKVGTDASELFDLCNIGERDNLVINNSLIGKEIIKHNFLINEDVNGFMTDKITFDEEIECINCGLCSEVCPLGLNPHLNDENCIKCGLCNFVCPAKINIFKRSKKDE